LLSKNGFAVEELHVSELPREEAPPEPLELPGVPLQNADYEGRGYRIVT
jgi:hypothetical protein